MEKMIEQLITAIGPAALAVAIMWRWLEATREQLKKERERYTELVDATRREAIEDREAYKTLVDQVTQQ